MADDPYLYYRVATFVAMYCGYTLYYFNRKTFAFVLPSLLNDVHMEKDDLGLIVSSLALAYAISKFVSGLLTDMLSARLLFPLGLALVGLMNILFSRSSSVEVFTAIWFANGLAQGFGWPPCAKILRQWFPPSQFGTWWAMLSTSMNVAGSVGPLVAAWLVPSLGWRGLMAGAGVVALGTSGMAFTVIREKPTDVGLAPIPGVGGTEKGRGGKHEGSVMALLTSPYLWLLSSSYLVVFGAKSALSDWGQLVLIQEKGHSLITGSSFISALEFGGLVGSIVAGYLSDRAVAKVGLSSQGNPRHGLLLLMMAVMTLSLTLFRMIVGPDSSQLWILSLGFTFGFCAYGSISLFGVLANEASVPSLCGTAHAVVALSANVGGFLAGLPISTVAQHWGWNAAVGCTELAALLATVAFISMRNICTTMGRVKAD
uniref:Solute carrier family 37 member 4a n=1 Tax=Eptatretus burgeri TaxID=7764 RepID=A0A8C4PVX8_EPTBU